MLGKAALLCASAQLEYGNDVGGVEDLLPFQASLTDIRTGQNTLEWLLLAHLLLEARG